MPFPYLVLDREPLRLVNPYASFKLIALVQELNLKLTSESDVTTRSPPRPPCYQKIPDDVTKQALTEKHDDPGISGPGAPDVLESIQCHYVQYQAKPLCTSHVRE